jgi:predicted ATPase
VGETRQIFPVLFGLWGLYETRGELHTARELADQFLSLAHRHQDPSLILQGHRAMGDTLYWLGEFVPARLHLEQGIALYDPQLHHTHAFLYGQDPAIGCLIYTALVLWILGYPDQSLQRCHEAIGLAQALSHPFSLAYTLNFAAALYRLRREWQEVHACAEQLMALAAKQGFSQLLDRGRYTRGTALVMQGQIEEGMTQIQQGLSNLRDTGAGLNQSSRLTMLAQVYGVAGHTAKGIQTLEDALRVAHKTGARVYQTERYRLKGELLLALTPQNWQEAETHFLAALDLARRQQAKSFELRAVISLSRLWQRQGKAREARHLLATIYHWFTEGLHTADIQEAHALLQELE